jgi:hypothetical protein
VRIVPTRRGARMEEGGLILSEILDRPGPTDSLFDVLAAAVAALAPGPDLAMLGFAGGGVVAPLRAMGFGHPIRAVDLSLEGEQVFRSLSVPWCGHVEVDEGEASVWLRRVRKRFDVILEDLSVPTSEGITKPGVSLDVLPALMRTRLKPRGLVVLNVLPVPGQPWTTLLPQLAAPYAEARVILLDVWENRILLLGDELPSAREAGAAMRRALDAIGSDEAHAFEVRTFATR